MVPPISTRGNGQCCIWGAAGLLSPGMEPTTGQQTFEQYMAEQAARQTSAIEKVRDYVFYLLLIAVLGVIAGVLVAVSSRSGL